MSDWGGVHDTKEALMSGLDIEMSVTNDFDQYYMAQPLIDLIERGEVDKNTALARIDEKVRHILNVMNALHMLDGERSAGGYNDYADKASLRQTARESIVLLKNDKNILPLDRKRIRKLLVVGENANRPHASGGGSAEIKALYEITPLMGIQMLLGGNTEVVYKPGYFNEDNGNIWASAADSENGQADSLNQDIVESPAPVAIEVSPEQKQYRLEMNENTCGKRLRRQRMPTQSSLWAG